MSTRLFALASILALAACHPASPGGDKKAADNTPARKERIVENLKTRFPQLAELNPTLGDIAYVPAGGLQQVDMSLQTPRGAQKQLLLLSPDDKQLYMVMQEPIDVSKSTADLKAEKDKQAQERKGELTRLVSGQPMRGNAAAKVTVIEFSDFQCPFCRRGFESVEQLLQKHPNDVNFVFLHYPLPFHPWAKPAAIAAVCAANQDKAAFWTLHDAFFKNQQEVTAENVLDKAKTYLAQSKIDMSKWEKCAKDEASPDHQAAAAAVDQSTQAGSKLGVDGTPAFFINGQLISGAVPVEELDAAVQKALNDRG